MFRLVVLIVLLVLPVALAITFDAYDAPGYERLMAIFLYTGLAMKAFSMLWSHELLGGTLQSAMHGLIFRGCLISGGLSAVYALYSTHSFLRLLTTGAASIMGAFLGVVLGTVAGFILCFLLQTLERFAGIEPPKPQKEPVSVVPEPSGPLPPVVSAEEMSGSFRRKSD